MQRRADATPDTAGRLELLIDLKIVARWLLQAAADAPAESDLQVCAAIRANHLQSMAAEAAAAFKTVAARPSAPQVDAMNQVHALTFKLGELKSVAQADEVCRQVGGQMVTAAGPLPANVRGLPVMRPAPLPADGGAAATTQPAAPAPADLATRINGLAITQPLRRQLLALLAASGGAGASAAAADPKASGEPAALAGMLTRAVELADGLQRGIGVEADMRVKMEAQLTDGLTLFTDPRTRTAGSARVTALDNYRRTLDRVRRLNLTPDLQKRLGPAFVWAQQNPEGGPRAMEAVEQYLQLAARADRRVAGAAPMPPREAKLLDELLRQFATKRAAFVDAAGNLGIGGLAGTTPDSLLADVGVLRDALERAESVERLPRAQQTLLALKPKPFGGLERRVTAAVLAMSDPKSEAKDDAADFVATIVRLASYAEQVGAAEGTAAAGSDIAREVSADVVKVYTRDNLAAFQAKRRQLVVEMANEASGMRDVDTSKMARLDGAQDMAVALREVAALEAALRRMDPASRWLDWGVDVARLRTLLDPYREAMASAFTAFATDAEPAVPWTPTRARFAPLVQLVIKASAYGPACGTLPTGVIGEIGKLVTPLDNAPFANERYAQFAIGLITRAEQGVPPDPAAATQVADALAERLRKSGGK